MKDVVALIFLFVIIAVALYAGLGAIGTIHSVNAGNCAMNSTGQIVNCSLSNTQFLQQNASATAAANIFQTLIATEWLVVAAIFGAIMLLLIAVVRRR